MDFLIYLPPPNFLDPLLFSHPNYLDPPFISHFRSEEKNNQDVNNLIHKGCWSEISQRTVSQILGNDASYTNILRAVSLYVQS